MPHLVENQGVIEIYDPDINVADLMERIRASMAGRTELPPLSAAIGRGPLLEERRNLLQEIRDLKERMQTLGIVDTQQSGWRARLELWLKKIIRKCINRHLHQQQQIHERLLTMLDQLVAFLDVQDRLISARFDQLEHDRERGMSAADEESEG